MRPFPRHRLEAHLESVKRALLFSAASLLTSASAWAMCPMCKKALEESHRGFIQGIYWSIVLMVSLPLAVFFIVWRAYVRLERKAKDASRAR